MQLIMAYFFGQIEECTECEYGREGCPKCRGHGYVGNRVLVWTYLKYLDVLCEFEDWKFKHATWKWVVCKFRGHKPHSRNSSWCRYCGSLI